MERIGRKSRQGNRLGIIFRSITFDFSHLGIRAGQESAKSNPEGASETKTAKLNTGRYRVRLPFP
jgi:hypothetical protein